MKKRQNKCDTRTSGLALPSSPSRLAMQLRLAIISTAIISTKKRMREAVMRNEEADQNKKATLRPRGYDGLYHRHSDMPRRG